MKITRTLVGFLVITMLASSFVAMPVFATDQPTKSETELLLDFPYMVGDKDFESTDDLGNQDRTLINTNTDYAVTPVTEEPSQRGDDKYIGLYESTQEVTVGDTRTETELINDLNMERKVDFLAGLSDLAKNVGSDGINQTTEIADGQLKLTTRSKTSSEEAYPSRAQATLINTINFIKGKSVSFKVRYDAFTGEQWGEIGEIQFYNGIARICMVMQLDGISFRDWTGKLTNCAHEAGNTYQYFLEYCEGATGELTDDFIRIWRRTLDSDPYTYMGKATYKNAANTTSSTVFIGRPGSTLYFDDITLYGNGSFTPEPQPDPDDPTTGVEMTAEELYGKYHFVTRKQDYPANSVNALDGRHDADKVSQTTKEGLSVMRLVGHPFEWKMGSTPQTWAQFNFKESATKFEANNGLLAVRFKLEGSGDVMLDFRSTTQIQLKVSNGGTINVDGNNKVTMASDGWHEIVVTTETDGDDVYGKFWYRSDDDKFKYCGKRVLTSCTDVGKLCVMPFSENLTVYIDSLTCRVKDVQLSDVNSIAKTEADCKGLAITADSAAKTLNISGSMTIGKEDSQYIRRATVISAGYNKEHGYTTFVNTKDYPTIYTGSQTSLADIVDVSDLGVEAQNSLLTKDSLGLMIWDTLHDAESGTGVAYHNAFYTKTSDNAVVPTNVAAGTPVENSVEGLRVVPKYNSVQLAGYVGKNEIVTAMIKNDAGIKAIGQATANEKGMIDMTISIDPYVNKGGEYNVWYQYGKEAVAKTQVTLYCAEDIKDASITDIASFISYVNEFGDENLKEYMMDADFANEAYDRFIKLGGMGSSETFDFFEFTKRVTMSIENEVAERALVVALNAATDWKTIKTLVVETYGSMLNITENSYKDVKSEDGLFRRMIAFNYTSEADVQQQFKAALEAQILKEKDNEKGNSNGGGGGNQFSSVKFSGSSAGNNVVSGGEVVGTISGGGVSIFNDLESVPWAEESILALRKKGILSGDNNRNFRPDDAITREEFLKLVMNAIGIPTGDDAKQFNDVDSSAWYYPYVAGAHKCGIVQGITETTFGIGENITRADMAVIIVRAMKVNGNAFEAKKAAYVFNDFDQIPQYAQESITILAENNLMNGVGNNIFAPRNNATRAEAAVAIYRIYNYVQKGE